MLDRLAVDPFADQLLLAAHVVDQPLDRLGEVRHGPGRGLVRAAAFRDHLAQPLDRGLDLALPPVAATGVSTPRSRTVVASQSSSSV